MAVDASRMPALSTEFRLLLLFSRLALDDSQARVAEALCEEVEDWEWVRQTAADRFILPVVYRHLRHLEPSSLPADQLAQMKQQVMLQYQHDLNVMASLGEIHQQLLVPLEIPYVTFKGPSLAARYYDEPAMRFCRDIDIMVPRERMVELIRHAFESGYKPLDPQGLASDPDSLAFVVRFLDVITLISPRGIAVEFHSRIDKIGAVYNSRALIDKAELNRVGNTDVAVLPTDELFVYVCLHHTRHFWSHLHWLVDLDAIQRHASFDRQEVLACADRYRLRTTVEASLKMAEVLATPEFDSQYLHDERVEELLRFSLEAMQGGSEVEHRLVDGRATPDFAFGWQTDRGHLLRWKLVGWVRFFRPEYALYRVWPLSPRWQWLYCLMRPWWAYRRRLLNRDTD